MKTIAAIPCRSCFRVNEVEVAPARTKRMPWRAVAGQKCWRCDAGLDALLARTAESEEQYWRRFWDREFLQIGRAA